MSNRYEDDTTESLQDLYTRWLKAHPTFPQCCAFENMACCEDGKHNREYQWLDLFVMRWEAAQDRENGEEESHHFGVLADCTFEPQEIDYIIDDTPA